MNKITIRITVHFNCDFKNISINLVWFATTIDENIQTTYFNENETKSPKRNRKQSTNVLIYFYDAIKVIGIIQKVIKKVKGKYQIIFLNIQSWYIRGLKL